MVRIPATIARLARCRKGAAAIEYALLIALIACAVTLATMRLGGDVNNTMDSVQHEMPGAKGTGAALGTP
jgi:Flp pilus assembly pilin Flp